MINSKGSSTYDNSVQAIDLFFDEYPEYRDVLHIHSFDGMGYNALYGVPVVHAAQMSADGASLEEILNYLTDILPRRQIYFGIYDLKFAAKSRRIPTAAAFLGTALNMKPGSPYELAYGSDPACLEELRCLMVQQLGYEPAAIYQIGAAIAANASPRAVGAAFTRKKES